MDKDLKILLTGVGTIGSELLIDLIRNNNYKVFLLVRNKGDRRADQRADLLFEKLELTEREIRRITVLQGDVAEENFGLSHESLKLLVDEVDFLIHTAAVTELTADQSLCESVNLGGTRIAISLAETLSREGRMRRLVYLSTAFVCGEEGISGVPVIEDGLHEKPNYSNFYEKSKFEAERLVRRRMKEGLSATIFRPSMVVGDTITGWTRNFNVIYPLSRVLSGGYLRTFPADPEGYLHFAPIDMVVRAISDSLENDWTDGLTFHLTAPTPPLTVSDFFACKGFFARSESSPRIVKPESFDWGSLAPRERDLLESIAFCLPYFNSRILFDTTNTKRLIELPQLDADYLELLAAFACRSGYLRTNRQAVQKEIKAAATVAV